MYDKQNMKEPMNRLIKQTHAIKHVKQMNSFKNITISLENYLHLKRLGQTADSFNDVLTNLLAGTQGDKGKEEKLESGIGIETPNQIPTITQTVGDMNG